MSNSTHNPNDINNDNQYINHNTPQSVSAQNIATHTITDTLTLAMQTASADIKLAKQLPVIWVKTTEELGLLLNKLASCRLVALDTEFIKQDTYYPILALIQVNTGDAIFLLDAPQLELQPLWHVLAQLPVMLWYACGEDLNIFYSLSGLPSLQNVFDVQVALAFLNGRLQIGYQQAVKQYLNIEIDKQHSRSDWLARPLMPEQESYAADDVRYLLPLFAQVQQALQKKDWLNLVWQDCQYYAKSLYDNLQITDDAQYLSCADCRYSSAQLLLLRDLMAWREALARSTNQPRTFILRKQGIRDIIELMPTSKKKLKTTNIHRNIVAQYGDEIVNLVIASGQIDASEHPPVIIPTYRSKNKSLQKLVKQTIQTYSEQTGINPNVLMKKKWLNQLYQLVALYEHSELNLHSLADNLNILDADKSTQDTPTKKTLQISGINNTLPEGLQGWRKPWVVNSLIPLLYAYRLELRQGMRLAKTA